MRTRQEVVEKLDMCNQLISETKWIIDILESRYKSSDIKFALSDINECLKENVDYWRGKLEGHMLVKDGLLWYLNERDMRYLITCDGHEPFLTKWFESENNFNPDLNMIVYDLVTMQYTTNGEIWKDIEIDHL